ncbi:hypothetical protein Kisp01_06660 [Kineosporia sp. NBRC 101677]|nr:hypothetical protein Kisp01_06660 [Kineosporia sp. NBRC 101677]
MDSSAEGRAGGPPSGTATVGDAFVHLVYEDEELLRAEFDEIVAALKVVPPQFDSPCPTTLFCGAGRCFDHREAALPIHADDPERRTPLPKERSPP